MIYETSEHALLRDTLARMPGVDVVYVNQALAQVTGHALGLH